MQIDALGLITVLRVRIHICSEDESRWQVVRIKFRIGKIGQGRRVIIKAWDLGNPPRIDVRA